MIYEVYKSNKLPSIPKDKHPELLSMLYNYCSRNEHIVGETYDQFAQDTALETNIVGEFTRVNIISEVKFINSSIIYSGQESNYTVFIHSNFTSILLLFLESISGCVLVRSRIDVRKLLQMITNETFNAKKSIKDIGNMEITYIVENKNLNTISINISQKDLAKLVPNINLKLVKFIRDTTSLNLDKLEMTKFLTNGISVLDSRTIKHVGEDEIALGVIHRCSS